MLCSACRSLPLALRDHPGPGATAVPGALRALVCGRCGGPAGLGCEPAILLDVLVRLERAGLGIAGPLMLAADAASRAG